MIFIFDLLNLGLSKLYFTFFYSYHMIINFKYFNIYYFVYLLKENNNNYKLWEISATCWQWHTSIINITSTIQDFIKTQWDKFFKDLS